MSLSKVRAWFGAALLAMSVAPLVGPMRSAGAAGTHAGTYVDEIFEAFLGRSPTAAEAGQAAGIPMTTAQGRLRLAENITTSPEWYLFTVTERYQQILGRPADFGGLVYWVNALASQQMSLGHMEARFYASDEYLADRTAQAWVGQLYEELLGRAADPGGLAYWTGVAAQRGRRSVAHDFLGSFEARARRVTLDYSQILHRAPDPGGLTYWARVESKVGEPRVATLLAATSEAYGPLLPGEVVAAPPAVPLAGRLAHNGLTSRVLTVRSTNWSSTTAEAIGWERTVVGWKPVLGPYGAHVGSRGWGRPTARREGDGTTPVGRYSFSGGFGLAANPGYALGWFVVGPRDYWTSDPSRSDYNTHQIGPADPTRAPWRSAEHLIDYPVAYRYAAVIDFNSPPTGAYGSAIFLHVSTGGPTAGCVSVAQSALVALLRWIDEGTRIVMGPDSVITSL